MSEAWYKEWCPKCKTVNWICNGDESDLSGIDLDGYKCRKCEHIELFPGVEPIEGIDDWNLNNLEDCNWYLGKETPN